MRRHKWHANHPRWTARLFNAVPGGDRLYLGGLHVDENGVGDFKHWWEEKRSKYAGKTFEEVYADKPRVYL